jgi:hypothetical protein
MPYRGFHDYYCMGHSILYRKKGTCPKKKALTHDFGRLGDFSRYDHSEGS